MARMARRRIDRKARAKMVSASPGHGGGWTQDVASERKLRLRDLELRLERLESEKRRLLEARQQLEAAHPDKFTEGAATGLENKAVLVPRCRRGPDDRPRHAALHG